MEKKPLPLIKFDAGHIGLYAVDVMVRSIYFNSRNSELGMMLHLS